MKKLLRSNKLCLFLVLSFLSFLVIASPVRGIGFFQELFEAIDWQEDKQEEDYSIFADPSCIQPTHNFSSGQMVYIKVTSPISGDREKTLRLLDSEKREVQKLGLNQAGNLFTASFAAPNTPGVYYVDIKIEDSSGSKFASQENINVGQDSDTVVESRAESVVDSTEQAMPTASPTITLTPTSRQTPPSEVVAPSPFIHQIIEFFRKLFSSLTPYNLTVRLFSIIHTRLTERF